MIDPKIIEFKRNLDLITDETIIMICAMTLASVGIPEQLSSTVSFKIMSDIREFMKEQLQNGS